MTDTFSTSGAGDERLQRMGKAFLLALYAAAQALKLYPLENQTVQRSLTELQRAAQRILDSEALIDLRMADDFMFMNDARLRMDLSTYGAFSLVTRLLSRHGVGEIEVGPKVKQAEWAPFVALLLREPDPETPPFVALMERIQESPIEWIRVGAAQAVTATESPEEQNLAREAAKRTYAQSVSVARQVLSDVRLGKAVNVRRVKRAVQAIVDQVLSNEQLMLGMSTLRDFDEYTFTHCVNVCIFSVIIGQKLGFSKLQLYELGLGALFHDIGKMRVGAELVNKPTKLTDEEFRLMQQHPTEGMLALFDMHGFGEAPWRAMLVAYEHHMKLDLSGYPRNRRPRKPTLMSRIVSVADAFEAGTAQRAYQLNPSRPELVLQEMRDNPRRGQDPLLVKALINVTGIFPVGTLAVLDTHELAVVIQANKDRTKLHQPIVKIISDGMGRPLSKPLMVDLSSVDPLSGRASRAIIKTTDPSKYGVRISDYFV
ncbi:MAG: HD domain-containing phosphohydrolase [Longimicrobiales bacterium]